MKNLIIVLLFAGCTVGILGLVYQQTQYQAPQPDGFEQILPRGQIASIDNPQYVSAEEAEISDKSHVLGIVVEGQPLAFSLNLLNNHEIVNGTVGKTNFAAVW